MTCDPDLLRLSKVDVEDAPNDQLDREPRPLVPTADQDAGLVLNRGGGADPALWPDRLGTDSAAANPWLSAPVRARCGRRTERGLLMQNPIVIRALVDAAL